MLLEKYSFGTGDRFKKEGRAQLAAIQEINKTAGIEVVPVWNKSYREHSIVNTNQQSVLKEATDAVEANKWKGNYYIDADHIGLSNVDEFLAYSNFFTIDVAHFIGQKAAEKAKDDFLKRYSSFIGKLAIPGIETAFDITEEFLSEFADTYIKALEAVKKIYNHIEAKKGKGNFVPEVSMDETDEAQSPIELFFILLELKHQGVEVQTIAPKFTGLFPKGVDYQGDVNGFAMEFEQDVAVTQFVAKKYSLPQNLKLSVHSGSDKFSIYPAMKKAIDKFDAGIHVKTAGTTWLEEIIGLAEAGGTGLEIAKQVYEKSMSRYDELTGPYTTVLNINKNKLPSVSEVNGWNSKQFVEALTHEQSCKNYNPNFRQLIHVGYKIAAEMGDVYQNALDSYQNIIHEKVKQNLYERHLKLLFA